MLPCPGARIKYSRLCVGENHWADSEYPDSRVENAQDLPYVQLDLLTLSAYPVINDVCITVPVAVSGKDSVETWRSKRGGANHERLLVHYAIAIATSVTCECHQIPAGVIEIEIH